MCDGYKRANGKLSLRYSGFRATKKKVKKKKNTLCTLYVLMATQKRGCLETTTMCCGAVVMELITRKNCTLKACTAHSTQQQKREHCNNKNKELRGNKTTATEHLYIYIYFFRCSQTLAHHVHCSSHSLTKLRPYFFAPFSQTWPESKLENNMRSLAVQRVYLHASRIQK